MLGVAHAHRPTGRREAFDGEEEDRTGTTRQKRPIENAELRREKIFFVGYNYIDFL